MELLLTCNMKYMETGEYEEKNIASGSNYSLDFACIRAR
jgi:hypothetical protein